MSPIRTRIRQLLVVDGGGGGLVAAAPQVPVREIVRRFWPYARPYRRWLALSLVLLAAGPAVQTAEIWLFKLVVDDVLVPRDFSPFVPLAIAFAVLALVGGVVSFADDVLSAWIGGRFLLALRTEVFRHVQGLSLDFFERRRVGDLVSRLTGDVAAVETFVLSGVAETISHTLRIGFFAGALFYLQWDLALVALTVAPLLWLLARRFSRLIKQASREKRRRSGAISAVAEESLGNAPLVQAYQRGETEVARFHAEALGSLRAELASTRLKALFTPAVELVDLAGALVVIGFGTWQLTQGRLSVGGLLAFLAYLSQLYSPLRGLARLANSVYAASASAERIIELLDERPAVADRPGAQRPRRVRGVVQMDNVCFRYPGSDRDALFDVSFCVGPGETLALVGPSGAGKSTLAKLLLRFYDPSRGRVLLDGVDLRDVELASLRSSCALLLQETLVFDGTARDNIAYGRVDAGDDEIVAAARAADAHAFISALPQGYETRVGQRGRRLSGGQRQRLAIARAMVRDAPVLVLDEPTTGLDGESAQRILAPLRRLMAGRTTIVISHSLVTVRDATSILVLDAGRVVEQGTHDELLARGGLYARLALLRGVEAQAVTA